MPIPIILDCDPGHDDTFAILLAAGSDRIDLLAVTTVAGNQVVEKSTLNARRVLSLAKVHGVPVAQGHGAPLLGGTGHGEGDRYGGGDVHGDSGLDGWEFDEPTVPQDPRHAVELMAQVLTAAPEPVTIVAVGPQTNVAALLTTAPHLKPAIKEIVCMAGSTTRGNFLPYSEANVLFDPEAAAVVLAAGVPITYVGLNVTHQALVTRDVLARISAVPRLGDVCEALLRFRSGAYDGIWQMPDPPLHDPVAVALLIDPDLVRCRRANVVVEVHGQYTRGATVIDLLGVTERAPNAEVALELDAPRFWDLLVGTLEGLA
ncbi:nucleoside hydrolase [Saccharothrix lopnurensis]|uniref:Nucleoside hydrolase n=1 Tax=Saccharothrix lopnurensis TaxID=1670621 RepID=A0ABW1PDI5_9PSEU